MSEQCGWITEQKSQYLKEEGTSVDLMKNKALGISSLPQQKNKTINLNLVWKMPEIEGIFKMKVCSSNRVPLLMHSLKS